MYNNKLMAKTNYKNNNNYLKVFCSNELLHNFPIITYDYNYNKQWSEILDLSSTSRISISQTTHNSLS